MPGRFRSAEIRGAEPAGTRTLTFKARSGYPRYDARLLLANNTLSERQFGMDSTDVGRQRKYPCP